MREEEGKERSSVKMLDPALALQYFMGVVKQRRPVVMELDQTRQSNVRMWLARRAHVLEGNTKKLVNCRVFMNMVQEMREILVGFTCPTASRLSQSCAVLGGILDN